MHHPKFDASSRGSFQMSTSSQMSGLGTTLDVGWAFDWLSRRLINLIGGLCWPRYIHQLVSANQHPLQFQSTLQNLPRSIRLCPKIQPFLPTQEIITLSQGLYDARHDCCLACCSSLACGISCVCLHRPGVRATLVDLRDATPGFRSARHYPDGWLGEKPLAPCRLAGVHRPLW